jgi:hypothetical protein
MQVDFLTQYITGILPSKRKTSSSGWISFCAPCCVHNGESADTRGRGGIIANGNGHISYSCFNCNYKTSFTPGRPLGYKFRKLLQWLGADENTIRYLVIKAIQLKDQVELIQPTVDKEIEPVNFKIRSLPAEAQSFYGLVESYELANKPYPKQFVDAVQYCSQRCIDMKRYNFYWTPEVEHKLSYRVIVPYIWKDQIIGYSARAISNSIKPKYYSNHEPNFVFNVNEQRSTSKFVIVVEGPFDAMVIDGVAVLSNECNEIQADIIDELGREVIVVPDFDVHVNDRNKKVWPGSKLVDQAVEYGWSVAFPVWAETCKDVSEAVEKYGKLFTLKTILDSKQHNKLKIELLKRKMFNGN